MKPSTALLLLCLALSAPTSSSSAQAYPTEVARAAELLGLPPDALAEGWVSEQRLPHVGATIRRVKGVSRTTGEVLRLDLDAHGRSVDLASLWKAEAELAAADPDAKLHPLLRDARDAAAPGATLPVIAWLAADGESIDRFAAERMGAVRARDAGREELREAEREIADFAILAAAAVTAPFSADAAAGGLPVRQVLESAPVVFLDVPVERVRELALRPDVRALFLETAGAVDANDLANATHRTGKVHARGVKGSGIRVAMLEDNGLDPLCPHLSTVAWFDFLVIDPDAHVHGTAGCVASQLPGRIGAAEGVSLYSANAATYSDADVSAAADWILNNDIDITNMSFGDNSTPNMMFLDHLFNYHTRYFRDSYVAAAGNDGSTVHTPAKAHNVIAVGNLDDQDTGQWADDVMNGNSSFVDPGTGCQKPNVAASGTDIETLSWPAPWTQENSGTSFAAPHCTGNLANALSVNPLPIAYPEAAMALMMATAWHNVEGASVLSDKDGAGAIHGFAAYECASDERVDGGYFTAADFDLQGRTVYNVWLEGGEQARICFAWSAQVIEQLPLFLTSFLALDYDIRIIEGKDQFGGLGLASSTSIANNYEIVEFTPPNTGWYSVRIEHNGTFVGPDEPWGIAWSQESDTHAFGLSGVAFDPGSGHGPLPLLNAVVQFDLPSKFEAAQPYFIVPSATAGGGPLLGGGKKLPVQVDALTKLWLAAPSFLWSGSVGTTETDGYTAYAMSIPNLSALVGLEFHLVPLYLSLASGPQVFDEVGAVESLTIHGSAQSLPLDVTGDWELVDLPFAFPFYGQTYTSCYVNANGTITFGAPDPTPVPTVAGLEQGPPRIAALWEDLDPQGGVVEVSSVATGSPRVVISFVGVPLTGGLSSTTGNTARVTLLPDGTVEIEYGLCELTTGLVGIAPGHGLSTAGERDLTFSGGQSAGSGEAFFELFGGGGIDEFDLGATPQTSGRAHWNSIRFEGPTDQYKLDIELASAYGG